MPSLMLFICLFRCEQEKIHTVCYPFLFSRLSHFAPHTLGAFFISSQRNYVSCVRAVRRRRLRSFVRTIRLFAHSFVHSICQCVICAYMRSRCFVPSPHPHSCTRYFCIKNRGKLLQPPDTGFIFSPHFGHFPASSAIFLAFSRQLANGIFHFFAKVLKIKGSRKCF